MATHSSTFAWRISWMEEPGRLSSLGSLRVGHDWATSLSHFSLSCIEEGNGNPLQSSCLETPRDGGSCWAAVYDIAQSRTWLTRLSSSSSNLLIGSTKLHSKGNVFRILFVGGGEELGTIIKSAPFLFSYQLSSCTLLNKTVSTNFKVLHIFM